METSWSFAVILTAWSLDFPTFLHVHAIKISCAYSIYIVITQLWLLNIRNHNDREMAYQLLTINSMSYMYSIRIALLWTILDRFCAVGIHQCTWPLVFFWTKTSVTCHPCWHEYIFCKVPRLVRIRRRPEHRFDMGSFNMQTHHSRDIWPAFNPLKPVGKDSIRSRLPDVFYQWLQLNYSSCTKDVFIRLQDAPRTIENWPQVRYIAIWTQHTRELNIHSNSDSCPIGVCVDPCEVGTTFAAPDSQI